ncbi:MAG: FecR domain-containing protein [Pseudomonadota bacterium]
MTTEPGDTIPGIDKALIDEALEWRALLDDGLVDSEKRAAFHVWVMADPSHMQAFDYAERFWEQLKLVSDPDSVRTGGFRPALEANARSAKRGRVLVRRSFAIGTLGAVALMIAGSLYRSQTDADDRPPSISYQTNTAEFLALDLIDGSSVVLGPGSLMETRVNDTERAVALLRGEAYFDVVEDSSRPFSVVSGSASISVVGTRFDVRKTTEGTQVAVADGRVEIGLLGLDPHDGSAVPVALAAGEAVAVGEHTVGKVSAISTDLVGAWRNNRLVFFNEPLNVVIEQVNRYDPRTIVLADSELSALTVSATLDVSDVDELLQTLVEIYPIEVSQQSAAELVISKKN